MNAPGRRDAWAIGLASYRRGRTRPIILHWNGWRWQSVTVPGTAAFWPSLVESSSPDDVWIFFGNTQTDRITNSEALVWNGETWHIVPTPIGVDGNPAVVLSSSDGWEIGLNSCSGGNDANCATTLWNYNGASWVWAVGSAGRSPREFAPQDSLIAVWGRLP